MEVKYVMFEDILGRNCENSSGELDTTSVTCPYCGASEVGLTSVGAQNVEFFCANCGFVWECD